MTRYFDRRGNALPNINAADWSDDGRRVAFTSLPSGVEVSTVHLVIDHSFGDGPPLIFETMIFGGPLDQEMRRYSTEEQAKAGHAEMVEDARGAASEAAQPDHGERIDLTAQVAAICAGLCAGLEADMTQAEYHLHAREAIGNDLIARACDGDDTEFLARRALRILCDGTDMPALRVDLLAVAR